MLYHGCVCKPTVAEAVVFPAVNLSEEQVPADTSLLRGYGFIAASAFLWSFGGVLVKYLTQVHHVPAPTLVCLRSVAGWLVLAWALPGIRKAPLLCTAGAALAYTGVVGSFVMATVGTSAANAIILQYTYPLIVAAGAVFIFRESLGKRTLASLAVGMTGIAILLIFSWTPRQSQGLVYGLFSGVAFAALTLFQSSIKSGSALGLASLYNLTAAILLLPFAWGKFHVSPEALLIIALMGAFQICLPYFLYFKGLQIVPSTDAALITLIEPTLNPVWVWLFVGETPQRCTIIGGAMILIALGVRFASVKRKT